MSLFQSALDFLAGPGSAGGAGRDHNDFVGQVVELGDMKLRIKRIIAEGEHEKKVSINREIERRLARLGTLANPAQTASRLAPG